MSLVQSVITNSSKLLESLNLNNAIAILVVIAIFVAAITYQTDPNALPIPSRRLPIVGHLPFLGQFPYIVLHIWSKIYGKVLQIQLGMKSLIVISEFSTIKKLYNLDEFNLRHEPAVFKKHFNSKGITFNSGDNWHSAKKLNIKILKDVLGRESAQTVILEQVKLIKNCIESGNPVDLVDVINPALNNIMVNTLFGFQFNWNDAKFQSLLHNLKSILKLSNHASWASSFPILEKLPLLGFDKPSKDLDLHFTQLFQVINNWVKELETGEISVSNTNNYTLNYLKQVEENYDREQLAASLANLLMGGTETNSATMRWAFVFLLENSHILENVQNELKALNKDLITWEDRSKLHYLQAFLMEVQRVGCVTTLGGSTLRVAGENCKIGDYQINKGAFIAANVYSIHYNEDYFSDPYKFNPERFLKDGELIIRSELIPFGMGKRRCPGEGLAKMEMFLIMANILNAFTFDAVDNSKIDSEINFTAGSVRSPLPYELVFKTKERV
ncbi:cytochrome P450 [Conidiobolus coronatus NRRL 28638]|uniref:Cytochrome P450 n=1 Tax=Conidiobolus coronatus (strain ATCC 28846 / CBS 209.66 / NRRL 28638) TaxID=796925 RepID=A0A137PH27_CONC2|nr:cytochrome P450 [Conidiobolus coronatus NRRL 28638]|eukprot:KXN74304.1 cytochrome P450 [Conidiobolus coronatus NRRL 28638]